MTGFTAVSLYGGIRNIDKSKNIIWETLECSVIFCRHTLTLLCKFGSMLDKLRLAFLVKCWVTQLHINLTICATNYQLPHIHLWLEKCFTPGIQRKDRLNRNHCRGRLGVLILLTNGDQCNVISLAKKLRICTKGGRANRILQIYFITNSIYMLSVLSGGGGGGLLLTGIKAWICNSHQGLLWDVITPACTKFNGCATKPRRS